MPNWCSNMVKVTGDAAIIDKMVEGFNKGELFGSILPIPAELQETSAPNRDEVNSDLMIEKYGSPDWYTWCCKNWGTKWDVGGDNGVSRTGNTVVFGFESAWSPPLAFCDHLVSLGMTVEAMYYEPGMAFCGTYADGVSEDFDISEMTAEETKNSIPEFLDEYFCISEQMAEWEEENAEEE